MKPLPTPCPPVWSLQMIAAHAGISSMSVYRMVKTGLLKAYEMPKTIVVLEADLREAMKHPERWPVGRAPRYPRNPRVRRQA